MKCYVTFRVNNRLYGVDIYCVKEIQCENELTPTPNALPYVKGLINVHGQIVTVLDIAVRIGVECEGTALSPYYVIFKTADELASNPVSRAMSSWPGSTEPLGFFVPEIGDVIETENDVLEPPPANLTDMEQRFLAGVVRAEGELLSVLDIERVFSSS